MLTQWYSTGLPPKIWLGRKRRTFKEKATCCSHTTVYFQKELAICMPKRSASKNQENLRKKPPSSATLQLVTVESMLPTLLVGITTSQPGPLRGRGSVGNATIMLLSLDSIIRSDRSITLSKSASLMSVWIILSSPSSSSRSNANSSDSWNQQPDIWIVSIMTTHLLFSQIQRNDNENWSNVPRPFKLDFICWIICFSKNMWNR